MTQNSGGEISENPEEPDELSPMTLNFIPHLEKNNKLVLAKILGSGSYSRVARATYGDKKIEVAAKIINITPTRDKEDYIRKFLPREQEIVRMLKHDNICRLYDIVTFTDHVVFITEFCGGGDLLKKMKEVKVMVEDDAKFIFRQFIGALMYLQSLNIVHRDLKCENIFLDKFENVKLGDFGFARVLRNGEKSNTFCGSRAYVAPEILRGKEYSGNAVDVWSSGVILFIMLTGAMPFDDRKPRKMIEKQLAHKVRMPGDNNIEDVDSGNSSTARTESSHLQIDHRIRLVEESAVLHEAGSSNQKALSIVETRLRKRGASNCRRPSCLAPPAPCFFFLFVTIQLSIFFFLIALLKILFTHRIILQTISQHFRFFFLFSHRPPPSPSSPPRGACIK